MKSRAEFIFWGCCVFFVPFIAVFFIVETVRSVSVLTVQEAEANASTPREWLTKINKDGKPFHRGHIPCSAGDTLIFNEHLGNALGFGGLHVTETLQDADKPASIFTKMWNEGSGRSAISGYLYVRVTVPKDVPDPWTTRVKVNFSDSRENRVYVFTTQKADKSLLLNVLVYGSIGTLVLGGFLGWKIHRELTTP